MGIGGISIWQLLIILLIVALIFGTKKLRNLGGDLGGAVKGFKKAISDDTDNKADTSDTEAESQASQSGAAEEQEKSSA